MIYYFLFRSFIHVNLIKFLANFSISNIDIQNNKIIYCKLQFYVMDKSTSLQYENLTLMIHILTFIKKLDCN